MIVNVTHMTRKETSTGGKMWTCRTTDPDVKTFNTFEVFDGFVEDMQSMKPDDVIQWSKPIECAIYQNGKYWNFGYLQSPRDGHEVVKPYVPDFEAWRLYAVTVFAQWILAGGAVLDTETSSLDPNAAILEIAVISLNENDPRKEMDFTSLVRYSGAIPSILPHLKADELATAPKWTTVSNHLYSACSNRLVIAYNAPFDKARVDYMNAVNGWIPISGMMWVDAMEVVSWYLGLWDASKQRWTSLALSEAYEQIIGVTMEADGLTAHGALADCEATKRIINQIAGVKDE